MFKKMGSRTKTYYAIAIITLIAASSAYVFFRPYALNITCSAAGCPYSIKGYWNSIEMSPTQTLVIPASDFTGSVTFTFYVTLAVAPPSWGTCYTLETCLVSWSLGGSTITGTSVNFASGSAQTYPTNGNTYVITVKANMLQGYSSMSQFLTYWGNTKLYGNFLAQAANSAWTEFGFTYEITTNTTAPPPPTVTNTGTIYGSVNAVNESCSSCVGLPIQGATVSFGSAGQTTTSATGAYSIVLPEGTYTVAASAPNYQSKSASVTMVAGAKVNQNFQLQATAPPAPSQEYGKILVTVMSNASTSVDGAVIQVSSTSSSSISSFLLYTNSSGVAFDTIPVGTYLVSAGAQGFSNSTSQSVTIQNSQTTAVTLTLNEIIAPSPPPYCFSCSQSNAQNNQTPILITTFIILVVAAIIVGIVAQKKKLLAFRR